MSTICRICMSVTEDIASLMIMCCDKKLILSNHGKMFEECCMIKVDALIDFANICMQCKIQLKYFHDFKMKALNTHKKLIKLIISKYNELEENYINQINCNTDSDNNEIDVTEIDLEKEYVNSMDIGKNSIKSPITIKIKENDSYENEEDKDSENESMTVEYLDDEIGNYFKYLEEALNSKNFCKKENYNSKKRKIENLQEPESENDNDDDNDKDEEYIMQGKDDVGYKKGEESDNLSTVVWENPRGQTENTSENNFVTKNKVKNRKTHYCNQCNSAFKKDDIYKAHMNVHNGLPPYSCKTCNKSFKFKNNYQYHMKNHQNNRKFICEVCSKRFLVKWDLRIHMRVHKDERPFICFKCGKQFRIHSHLADHLETHIEEKKYECSYCNQKFKTKSTLRMHKDTIHERPKRFSCKRCGRTFNRGHHLKIHWKCCENKSDIGKN